MQRFTLLLIIALVTSIFAVSAQVESNIISVDNAAQLEEIMVFGQDARSGLAFSPDGSILAITATDSNEIQLWDLSTGLQQTELVGDTRGTGTLSFSPNGHILASGSGLGAEGIVKLWDVDTGEQIAVLGGNVNIVSDLAFSPDGTMLAVGGGCGNIYEGRCDDSVLLWELESGELLYNLTGEREQGTFSQPHVEFSADGTSLFIVRDQGIISLWDVAENEPGELWTEHTEPIVSIALSSDGGRLATADANSVYVWNLLTETQLSLIQSHYNNITDIAFNADATVVMSWEYGMKGELFGDMETFPSNELITLWNAETGEELVTLNIIDSFIHGVVFSQDGTLLAISADDGVHIWGLTS